MARLIYSDLFEDDFIGSLSFFERLLWIGLFGAVADDQGRFLDSPALIRAKVFLYDANVTDDMVEMAIEKLASAGKIVRYSAGGKRLCQIKNWWRYQKPSWASESKYPPPVGWNDRVRMHVQGRVVSKGWETQGGFSEQGSQLPSEQGSQLPSEQGSQLPSGQGSQLPSGQGMRIKEVKDEVKGEDEDEGKDEEVADLGRIFTKYEQEIGPLTPMIRDSIMDAAQSYPLEWLEASMKEAARANARNWRYCEAILKRWKAEGFRSRSKSKSNGPADTKDVIEQVVMMQSTQKMKGGRNGGN